MATFTTNLVMSTEFKVDLGDPSNINASWINIRVSNCGSISLRIWDNKNHKVIEQFIHATELAALLYKHRNADYYEIYKSVTKAIENNHI